MPTIDELVDEAMARERRTLPPPSRLTIIRVWEQDGVWHAETGQAPHNLAVAGSPFPSEADAVAHAITVVIDARQQLALNLELDLRNRLKQCPEPRVYYGPPP